MIKQRLSKIGKSQGWLSERTGFKREYINRVCTGQVPNPRVKNCLIIAKNLGCLVEELWIIK